jgi:hypothetical protein
VGEHAVESLTKDQDQATVRPGAARDDFSQPTCFLRSPQNARMAESFVIGRSITSFEIGLRAFFVRE